MGSVKKWLDQYQYQCSWLSSSATYILHTVLVASHQCYHSPHRRTMWPGYETPGGTSDLQIPTDRNKNKTQDLHWIPKFCYFHNFAGPVVTGGTINNGRTMTTVFATARGNSGRSRGNHTFARYFLGEYFFRSTSDFAAFFVGCGIKMVSLAMATVMSGAELFSQARCWECWGW